MDDVQGVVGDLHRPGVARGIGRRPEDQDSRALALPLGSLSCHGRAAAPRQFAVTVAIESAQRMRWSVGSSAIECNSQSSAPGAPCRTQCSVPPLDVLVGCQLAPRATSSRPSRSMSFKDRHTLSFGVSPLYDRALLPCRRFEPHQVGRVDRDDIRAPIAIDIAGRYRVADAEVGGNLLRSKRDGRAGGRRIARGRLRSPVASVTRAPTTMASPIDGPTIPAGVDVFMARESTAAAV